MSHIPIQTSERTRTASFHELFNWQYPTALSFNDADGRSLGEGNGPHGQVNIEWKPSRYPRSRAGSDKQINNSALRQMGQHWLELLELIDELRAGYAERFGVDGAFNLRDLWRFSRISIALPNYLVNRWVDPLSPDEIPALLSSTFKTMVGLVIFSTDVFLSGLSLDLEFSTDDLLDHVEDNNLFQGGQGVCAGPPNLVRQLLDAVLIGRAHPKTSWLPELIGDVDRAFRYGALYSQIEVIKNGFRFESQHLLARFCDRVRDSVAPPDVKSSVLSRFAQAAGFEGPDGTGDQERRLRQLSLFRDEAAGLIWYREKPQRESDSPMSSARTLAPIRDFIGSAGPALDDGLLETAAQAVSECVDLQRSTLKTLSEAQTEIDQLLERAPSKRKLDSGDLARAVGRLPLSDFSGWLGIAMQHDLGVLTLRQGRSRLQVSLEA